MFFDMHSDILYDIVRKRLKNKKNIIKDDHLSSLVKGNIIGGIWNYYTDITHPLCEFNQAIDLILEELELASDYINIIKGKNDFKTNKINVLLGFESLQPIKDSNHLKAMYDLGFRHAMLTWNEQNQFGTGVLGNDLEGLTEAGKNIIEYMNHNQMIVDVSHANKRTFDEILDFTQKPVIASHSNVYNLCEHKRNLDDEQIKKIFSKNGIIGVTSIKGFVNKINPTIKNMVDHIDYLINIGSIDQIAIGFDYTDYLKNPQYEKLANLDDMYTTALSNRLIDELRYRNYTQYEIDKITFKNAVAYIKRCMK